MVEIRDEIGGIFKAHGEANQAIADAQGAARLGGEARVRHERRVLGERFDAAEALGACKNAKRA